MGGNYNDSDRFESRLGHWLLDSLFSLLSSVHIHELRHTWSVPFSWRVCCSVHLGLGLSTSLFLLGFYVNIFLGTLLSTLRCTWRLPPNLDSILVAFSVKILAVLPSVTCFIPQEFHFCRFNFCFILLLYIAHISDLYVSAGALICVSFLLLFSNVLLPGPHMWLHLFTLVSKSLFLEPVIVYSK